MNSQKNTAVLAARGTVASLAMLICLCIVHAISAEPVSTRFGVNMIAVPDGRFQRDSNPENVSVVRSFRIASTEVTRALYKEVMGVDPSPEYATPGGDTPVTMPNWYHAIAFCNKLSLLDSRAPAYAVEGIADWAALAYASIPKTKNAMWDGATCDWDSDGYRLPTEMEWMWAAMGAPLDGRNGGTNTSGYLKKFSGDDGTGAIKEYANVESNREIGILGTRGVGLRRPNEIGLYDMSGNVWEWCWDWYANISGQYSLRGVEGQQYKVQGMAVDYRGGKKSDNGHKVIRGGGFYGDDASCHLSYRMISSTTNGSASYGLRIACSK